MELEQFKELVTVEIKLHSEDTHPRDYFDSAYDRESIVQESEWNEWVWCCVELIATYEGISESSFLGACSYKDESDFRECGYFEDMKKECIKALYERIKNLVQEW